MLILDVQSSLVRGSLVRLSAGTAPEIIFTHEQDIPYRPHGGSAYLIKVGLRAIEEAVGAALQCAALNRDSGAMARIEAVHYVLSSPWIVSQAKTLSLSFPEDTEITQSLVSDAINKEQMKLTPGAAPGSFEIVERKAFDVRLNGYSVSSWQGKQARTVEISCVISMAGSQIAERFRHACARAVKPSRVSFHSSLLLQQMAISSVMPDRLSYTLIHIHGELTDVVVVEKGTCSFFGSYPSGVRTVIRKIAHTSKTEQQAAESLLTLYERSHLDGSLDRTASFIEDIGKGWSIDLSRLLEKAGYSQPLPRDTIVSSRIHEGFFMRAFEAARPGSHTESLTTDELSSKVSYGPSVEHLRQAGLYAIALSSFPA